MYIVIADQSCHNITERTLCNNVGIKHDCEFMVHIICTDYLLQNKQWHEET